VLRERDADDFDLLESARKHTKRPINAVIVSGNRLDSHCPVSDYTGVSPPDSAAILAVSIGHFFTGLSANVMATVV
jgi:hypothetical protein